MAKRCGGDRGALGLIGPDYSARGDQAAAG